MNLKVLLSCSLIILYGISASAQSPVADFSLPSQGICLNSLVAPSNQSLNSVSYEWDFCSGDLANSNLTVTTKSNSSLGVPQGTSFLKYNGNWYGFIACVDGNNIVRLDFGATLTNKSPTITNLGNFGGMLSFPQDIKAVTDGNQIYLFISNSTTNKFIRINLGTDINNNTPTTDILLPGDKDDYNNGVEVAFDGTNWFAFYTSSQAVRILKLGSSLAGIPSASDIMLTSNMINISGVGDISLVKQGSNWYGFVVGYRSATMYRLSFGTNLFSDPAQADITPAGMSGNVPQSIVLRQEGGNNYGFISTQSGNLLRLDFGTDVTGGFTFNSLGNYSSLTRTYKLDIVQENSNWRGLMTNNQSNNFFLLDFPNNCGASISTSNAFAPVVSYANSGIFHMSLTATDQTGAYSVVSKGFTVMNATAPVINFSSSNKCTNNPIDFSATSDQSIDTYLWDFGDGTNSSGVSSSASHSYSTASSYIVNLTVTSSNTCNNSFNKTIPIFNPPQANFSLPLASPLCTNQNYLFTNTSTSDPGSNPTWQWSANGSNVSTTQDLTYLFTSSVSQSVTLTASIPGCSTQSTQNLTALVDGPLISFNSASGGCQGSSIAFTNTTTDPVTSFTWNFGDGNSSSQQSASNSYSSAGNYAVSLSGTNSNGCQNSYSKNITIYSLPQPNFAIEAPPLSCEKTPSQFDNLTPALVDSNISSWAWKFGDANQGSSSVKNPTYTYITANSYTVSLRATTNVGCKDSIQKSITILASPQAGFTNSAACINQSTHFTDASSGSISFYQWNVQNIVLSGATPSYVFKTAGSFPVTLTVTGSNGCLNQSQKTIQVPVMPVVDFSVQSPCTGHPTIFQEINSGGSDPAVAWNWDFGQSSATGSPVNYQFPSEGGYAVTMNTTRQSGCIYSAQKNIAITTGPVASFTPSAFAGAAPLDVIFNNTSTADSYLWQFGDPLPTTSTLASPEFVYTQLGKYKVLLTAFNAIGCSDTLSTEIDVVIPHIDIVMNNFSLTNDPNTNSSKAIVTLLNSGNIPLVDPEVLIDFGGDASVKEKITGLIRPGKTLMQTLGLQIIPRSLEYICAEINVANDANIHNNKQCVPLLDEDVVLTPYPNPSTSGQVTIEWVEVAQEDIVITIFKSSGETAFEQHLDKNSAGLGQLTINTFSFGNGLYLIQFTGNKTTKTFRIMIAN